jgi:cytochrome c oxidase subunit 2
VPLDDLKEGDFRGLDVDTRALIPLSLHSRLLISGVDVLHSFAIPSASLKVDAVPGRVNQLSISPLHSGVLYGQCREICGANHRFMPIVVEVVPILNFCK